MTMEQNAQPIRVAQMMTDMNYGGVEMVVMNYYRHMDRSRVQFDFFALEGSTLPQREEIERLGGRVYVVPKYTHLPQYEREIGRLFRQNGYQIVHSHMNTLSVLSLWGAKRAGVPNRIAHNHSTVGRGEGAKNVMKYLLRPFATVYPTRLCACSRTAGSWLYGESLSGCSTMPLSSTALLMMPPNGKSSGRSLAWGMNWCWAMSGGSAMPKITNFCWM